MKDKTGVVLIPYITTQAQMELFYLTYQSINMQGDYEFYFILPQESVSKAWNTGIDMALKDGCKYVLVPNGDVELHEGCMEALVGFMKKKRPIMVSPWCTRYERGVAENFKVDRVTMTDNYSCFMVDSRLFEKVGRFDENFKPAYLEDCDMQHRIDLAGEEHWCIKDGQFDHYRSATIELHRDPEWARDALSYKRQFGYFEKKWGGGPRDGNLWREPFHGG